MVAWMPQTLRMRLLTYTCLCLRLGKVPTHDLLRGVLGSFKVLYGDERFLFEYAKVLGDPSFEEAYSSLRGASMLFRLALKMTEQLDRNRLLKEAFDALFHASRIASMIHLSTGVGRWGLLGGGYLNSIELNLKSLLR